MDEEDIAALQRTISDQIDWLMKVLDLVVPADGERLRTDVGVDIRTALSKGRINEGTINAAIAATLGKYFWPNVEADVAEAIRSKYKELSAERPPVRCRGEGLEQEFDWNRVNGLQRTDPQLVEEVVTALCQKHDLASEHSSSRVAEVHKRIHEKRVNGFEDRAAARMVSEELGRFIAQEQTKYRVNAKRGVQARNAIWRSKAIAAICICTGCVLTRTNGAPTGSIGNLMPIDDELLRSLRAEVSLIVPRKYLDVLRLDLVVMADLLRDLSKFTCHQDRVSRMTLLVVSNFNPSSSNPEKDYVRKLEVALMDVLPSISERAATRVTSSERRPISTWQDAEENAAAWMRYFGFKNARVTAGGADGGIDVIADDAVAQVKREAIAVGSPAIQRLYGAASAHGTYKHKLFFSASGYSRSAEDFARRLGIALFNYDREGRVDPANPAANTIYRTLRPAGGHDDLLARY